MKVKPLLHPLLAILVLCLLCPGMGRSQSNALIDSLEHQLPTLEGKARTKALNDLCWEYRNIDADKALEYGNQGLALATEMGDSVGIAQSYNDMGAILHTVGRYDEAIESLNNSLAIREALKDTVGMASIYGKLGNVHERRTNLDVAMEYWLKSLVIFEQIDHKAYVSYLLNNIAVINQHQGNYEVALDYYGRSIAIKKEIEDWAEVAGSYLNVGNIHRLQGNDSLALYWCLLGVEMAIAEDAPVYEGQGLNIVGSIHMDAKRFDEALGYLEKGLAVRLEIEDRKGEASSRINLGHCYSNMGRYKESEQELLAALAIATEIGIKQEIQNSHLHLSQLYEKQSGKMALALDHHKQFSAMRDSILNTDKQQQISELQTRYETSKKERELQAAKLENAEQALQMAQTEAELTQSYWLIGALVSGLLLFLLLGVLIYRQQKLRQRQIETEARIQQQQIQLQAILQGEERERKRLASELHDGLGQMLSTIKLNVSGFQHELQADEGEPEKALNTSLELIDDAVSELRNISHNLMPSALLQLGLVPALEELVSKINRTGQLDVRFQTFGMEARQDSSLEVTLYRVVQELLNNALKYSKASSISVQLLKEGGELNVMVEDNGVGFDTSKLKTSTGIGWQNMNSRVEMLGGTIEVDSQPGHGTTVIIDVPEAA